MRPTKLNSHVVEAFQAVLNEDMNVLVCTDSQLFFLLNERLDDSSKISYRSFQRYKVFATRYGASYTNFPNEDEPEKGESFPDIYSQLYRLFMHALIAQKRALFTKMLGDVHGWHRYKWILERKFREWSVNWADDNEKREQHWLDREEIDNDGVTDFEIQIVPVPLDNQASEEGEKRVAKPPGLLPEDDPDYVQPAADPTASKGAFFIDERGHFRWTQTGKRWTKPGQNWKNSENSCNEQNEQENRDS